PFDKEARAALGRIALARSDAPSAEFAAREFRTVIALKPIDPAVAHADLAESYLKLGKRDDAKRQALASLEIAPTYARAQDLLLRGGTVMFDDFHGPFEWDNLERQMKRVFPDRRIVEVPQNHPVFSVFYKIDGYPQVAGIGSFLAGRTWEKGGFVSHLRTIFD